MIDSHCHLADDRLYADLSFQLSEARRMGVEGFITISTIEQLDRSRSIVEENPDCRFATGIHPLFPPIDSTRALEVLEEAVERDDPVAVGEVGLDGYHDKAAIDGQEFLFAAQLDLARRRALPVIVHTRRAIERTIELLDRHRIDRGVIHGFSGSLESANQLIRRGFLIGIGASFSRRGARRPREVACKLPLTSILLETDAPDGAPDWIAGRINSPAQLPAIGRTLAELRGVDFDLIARQTTANAKKLFGFPAN